MKPGTITVDGVKFLIRGFWTAQELKNQYDSFQAKYQSKLSFRQWLVERGKVVKRQNT